ncbi:MAG: hypothetical protein ACON5F_05125 [Jejuia sp.]
MKRLPFLIIFLIIFFNPLHSQEVQDECRTKLSLSHEPVKIKDYDKAYNAWVYVKKIALN